MVNIQVGCTWRKMIIGRYEHGRGEVFPQKRKMEIDKELNEI
jgi:hypothetical protein